MARKPKRSQSEMEFPVFATFRSFKGSRFEWYQPRGLHRYHELSEGDQLFATLKWLEVFGSLAMLESSEGSFTLKRRGFLKPYVSVRDAGFDTDYAVLRPNMFSGGTLTFSDGRQFTFTTPRFWGYEWSFKDENCASVCSIRLRSAFKESGDVVVSPEATRDKRLIVTIGATYYAMLMANEEAAVAGVAVAST